MLSRRARAWELSIAGWSQRQIAAELRVSQAAVSKMLARAGKECHRDMRRQATTHLARTVGQYDELYRETPAAWQKSKGDQTRRRHRRVDGAPGSAGTGGSTTVTEGEVITREGDPRFIGHMFRQLQEKRTLIEHIAGDRPVDPPPPFDSEAFVKKLMRMFTLGALPAGEAHVAGQYELVTDAARAAANCGNAHDWRGRELQDKVAPQAQHLWPFSCLG